MAVRLVRAALPQPRTRSRTGRRPWEPRARRLLLFRRGPVLGLTSVPFGSSIPALRGRPPPIHDGRGKSARADCPSARAGRSWSLVDDRFAAPPNGSANHLERPSPCHRSLARVGTRLAAGSSAESSFYPPLVTCAAGILYFALAHRGPHPPGGDWAFLSWGQPRCSGPGTACSKARAGSRRVSLREPPPFVVFMLLNFQLASPGRDGGLSLYTLVRTEIVGAEVGARLGWCWSWAAHPSLPPPRHLRGAPLGAWRGFLVPGAPGRLLRLPRRAWGCPPRLAGRGTGPAWSGDRRQISNRLSSRRAESVPRPCARARRLLFYPQ